MDFRRFARLVLVSTCFVPGASSFAQSTSPGQTAPQSPAPAAAPQASPASGAPAPLVVLFAVGSSTLGTKEKGVLDQAARAYNEGRPIVMILTGSSDKVGSAQSNLVLSQRRANAVLRGLLDRGIPANRFQVLAKGETEPAVAAPTGVPEARNRSVEITWH